MGKLGFVASLDLSREKEKNCMLRKPGQPVSPEHLSFTLSLPFSAAPHNPTVAAALHPLSPQQPS